MLTEAKRILESEDFLKYIESIGIKSNGNSIRISGTDIKNISTNRKEKYMSKVNFNVNAYTARLIGRENVATLNGAILELVKTHMTRMLLSVYYIMMI